jgi:hypothetical protein
VLCARTQCGGDDCPQTSEPYPVDQIAGSGMSDYRDCCLEERTDRGPDLLRMSSGCPGLPDVDGPDAACARRRRRTADFAIAGRDRQTGRANRRGPESDLAERVAAVR